MAIEFTFHGPRNESASSMAADALPAQSSNAVAVADGAFSSALAASGLYRIKATSACRVRAGFGVTNATAGAIFSAGETEVWRLKKNMVIAVDLVA